MSFAIIGLGVGVASAAYGIGTGIDQKDKAKRSAAQAELYKPVEKLPPELLENQTNARIASQTGMPSQQYNAAMQNIQRTQAKAIRDAQGRRVGGAMATAVQDNTNNALLDLDVQNAKQRVANQRTLIGVNKDISGTKRDIFNRDARQAYEAKYNYAMSLLGAGNMNIANGVNAGLSAVGNFAANSANKTPNQNRQNRQTANRLSKQTRVDGGAVLSIEKPAPSINKYTVGDMNTPAIAAPSRSQFADNPYQFWL
jgi:hypothetical protein